ncbi:hypothetical protein LJC45_02925 [Alistipes sp. OttesenSCG-928-B03]|nr:hypothetical protein [Alistipes sp. OttesenSCG-928-B03]
MSGIAASVIGAVGAATGGMISSAGSKRAAKQAAKENRKMYATQRADALTDYQTQRADALADWNRENEYNSPTAQMARYRDAGLNPNLIYGEGVAASSGQADNVRETNTRAAQSGNTPMARYNIDFGMQQFAQNSLIFAQADKIKAETKNIKAQTDKYGAETDNILADTDRLRSILPFDLDKRRIDMRRAEKDIEKIASEIAVNNAELDTKAQGLIESNARVRKMFQDTLLAKMQLENAIENTEIRRGELSATQQDVQTRMWDSTVRSARLHFDRQRATFEDTLKKRGVEIDQFGNFYKLLGTGIRTAFGQGVPPMENYSDPDYR